MYRRRSDVKVFDFMDLSTRQSDAVISVALFGDGPRNDSYFPYTIGSYDDRIHTGSEEEVAALKELDNGLMDCGASDGEKILFWVCW